MFNHYRAHSQIVTRYQVQWPPMAPMFVTFRVHQTLHLDRGHCYTQLPSITTPISPIIIDFSKNPLHGQWSTRYITRDINVTRRQPKTFRAWQSMRYTAAIIRVTPIQTHFKPSWAKCWPLVARISQQFTHRAYKQQISAPARFKQHNWHHWPDETTQSSTSTTAGETSYQDQPQ